MDEIEFRHYIYLCEHLIEYKDMTEGEASFVHHSNLLRDLIGLHCYFLSCQFQYLNRMRNNVAHKLARHMLDKLKIYIFGAIQFRIF